MVIFCDEHFAPIMLLHQILAHSFPKILLYPTHVLHFFSLQLTTLSNALRSALCLHLPPQVAASAMPSALDIVATPKDASTPCIHH